MKKLNILIGLMLIAILALVAFQLYWIKNAIQTKNDDFDRKVMNVLTNTSEKLEKQEVIYLTKLKIANKEKSRILGISKNKLLKKKKKKVQNYVLQPNYILDTTSFENNFETLIESQFIQDNFSVNINFKSDRLPDYILWPPAYESKIFKDLIIEEQMTEELFNKNATEIAKKQSQISELMTIVDAENYYQSNNKENIAFGYDASNLEKENKNYFPAKQLKDISKEEKTNLVKDVLKDFILGKRNIYERVGHFMLDTLLKSEFKNSGINIDFKYNVRDNGNLVFSSFGNKNKNEDFKIKLFPHDTFQQNQYLEVYFPEKDNYILSNLWNVVGSSLLLILVVGGIFYYSVNTMLSQKKLSIIKNDFINNMTHELKTPVSTIALALEVIKDKDFEKNLVTTERYLNIIGEENKRLGTQVEKVLQIAQLDNGNIALNFESIDIKNTITQVIKNISVQAEQINATIDTAGIENNIFVLADELHLTNVFFNLIDNALKYSNKNPIISIKTTQDATNVYIKIVDNGIGIPSDQLSKIFDKFFRVPKGNLHDVKGFGIGLSYTKSMLALHKGRISVRSKINEGSEFTVELPKNI